MLKKIRVFFTSESILTFSLILLAAFIFFWRLGEPAFKDWDESIYGEVSKEILQTGNWLNLQWDGKPWFEKPPLTFWFTALLFRLFGVNEFWARAVSAASAVGITFLTYLIARLVHGRTCGLIAALVLLATFHFVQGGRLLSTDVLLVLFIYSAVYFYLRSRQGDQRWWYLISMSCALAFLVKDFAALAVVPALGLALWLDRRLIETGRSLHFWLSIVVALAIVAPWHIYMYQLHGAAFLNEYFTYHVFNRVVTPIEGHKQPYLFYVSQIMEKFYPWWVFMPFAFFFSVRQAVRGRAPSWILIMLIAVVFAFYTAAQTKLFWYILPLYPSMAVLVGHLFAQIYKLHIGSSAQLSRWIVILLCVGFSYAAIGKIRPYYVKMEDEGSAIKELSLLARKQSTTSHPVLLFSTDGQLFRQGVLFYSGRHVQQATTSDHLVNLRTRYRDYVKLSDLVTDSAHEILLNRKDLAPLLEDYEVQIIAESYDLVYGRISRKVCVTDP